MTNTNTQTKKEAVAYLRHARMAPRKVRLVADLIRGVELNKAEAELHVSARRPSVELLKLVRSAAANAEHNHDMNRNKLYVKEIRVDEGPVFKRWEPRAQGRVGMIQKKTSHIKVVLGEKDDASMPKYNIPTTEKTEAPEEEKKTTDKKQKPDVTAPQPKAEQKMKEKPGFVDKIFRRKSI